MLTIRLQRIGKKHQPSYRLVVVERRSKMAAPPTEDLGAYNPFTKKASFKADRVQYWLGVGAQPTVSSHNLLVKAGVVTTPKRKVYMKQAVVKVVEPIVEKPVASSPVESPSVVTEEAPVEQPAAEPVAEPAAE